MSCSPALRGSINQRFPDENSRALPAVGGEPGVVDFQEGIAEAASQGLAVPGKP